MACAVHRICEGYVQEMSCFLHKRKCVSRMTCTVYRICEGNVELTFSVPFLYTINVRKFHIWFSGVCDQEQDSTVSRPFGKLHTQCTTKGSDQLDHKQAKVHHDRVEID